MSEYIKRDKASRYINQDRVIDAVLNLDTSNRISWRDAVIDMIDAMPSEDVQPVVLCKKCKYGAPNGVYGCRLERFSCFDDYVRMYGEDFCSKGKPKGEDNEID